jgi:chromosome segregation ATPase
MRIKKTTTFLLILLLSAFLLSSCSVPQERAQTVAGPDPAEGRQNASIAKRFQESAPQGPTAVESAIGLSEKYAKLSEEASVLRRENQDSATKNQQFKERVTNLETQLQQTQKELSEATNFLIDMRIELNNWKTDVLGFRDEMRDAEKAQLEALLKILKVLGGEVATEPAQQKDTGSLAAEPRESKPGEHQPQQTPASGGSNE